MARPRAAAALFLVLCAIWTVPSHRLFLLVLREGYRLGEIIGVTPIPPAPGARLAGQVAGFNFHEPPAWYGRATHAIAAAVAMAPIVIPVLGLRRRIGAGTRGWCRGPGTAVLRGPLAALIGGLVFAALIRWIGQPLSDVVFRLGERLGGTVVRIGTLWASDPGGPFVGGTGVDALGNALVRSGPYVVCQFTASVASLTTHVLLWRSDTRAAATGITCRDCRYDLRGTPAGAPCPECGRIWSG